MDRFLNIGSGSACAVAMLFCAIAEASPLDTVFSVDGLQTEIAQNEAFINTPSRTNFSQSFSGNLITSATGQLAVGTSDFLGAGWSLTSFSAVQSFVSGSLVDGSVTFTASHAGGATDTFAATFQSNPGGQNISWDKASGRYSITTEIDTVTLSGIGLSDGSFAGQAISASVMEAWLGGALNFQFSPDRFGIDSNASVDMTVSVIPLPAPVLMGLSGLLPVLIWGRLGRRRRQERCRNSLAWNE